MIPTRLIIQGIAERERCGCDPIAKSLALVKLRERYDTFDIDDLPEDERTWAGFVSKHLRLPPGRADILLGRMVAMGSLLRCAKCQAESMSACACGQPYTPAHRWMRPGLDAEVIALAPSQLAHAMAAVEAHPERSNRAIAAEIHVSEATVRRARRNTEEMAGA